MPDPNNFNKLGTIGLKPCSRCGNPFMIDLEVNSKPDKELVCDNCINSDGELTEDGLIVEEIIDKIIDRDDELFRSHDY